MGKPSKYEKETIINFNEGEKEASVYTFNADLKRRLAEFSKKYPLLCRLEKSTPEGRQMPFSLSGGRVFFCLHRKKKPGSLLSGFQKKLEFSHLYNSYSE